MLTDTCTISRETAGRGAMFEPLHQYAVVAADVPCRVILSNAGDEGSASEGAAETIVERYRLITPVGTAFEVDDRVTVGGAVYDVVEINDRLTDNAFVEVTMRRGRDG